MLELRPSCECCDKNLPPETTEALFARYGPRYRLLATVTARGSRRQPVAPTAG